MLPLVVRFYERGLADRRISESPLARGDGAPPQSIIQGKDLRGSNGDKSEKSERLEDGSSKQQAAFTKAPRQTPDQSALDDGCDESHDHQHRPREGGGALDSLVGMGKGFAREPDAINVESQDLFHHRKGGCKGKIQRKQPKNIRKL